MELLRLLAARVSRPALGENAPKRRSQTLAMALKELPRCSSPVQFLY